MNKITYVKKYLDISRNGGAYADAFEKGTVIYVRGYKNLKTDPTPDDAQTTIEDVKLVLDEFTKHPKCSRFIGEAKEVHAKMLREISKQGVVTETLSLPAVSTGEGQGIGDFVKEQLPFNRIFDCYSDGFFNCHSITS